VAALDAGFELTGVTVALAVALVEVNFKVVFKIDGEENTALEAVAGIAAACAPLFPAVIVGTTS
jgi:hypothetical protein